MLSLMDTMVSLVVKSYRNSLVSYTFEYIWKWMYIRTQHSLLVGVSDTLVENKKYQMACAASEGIKAGEQKGLGDL